MISPHLSDSQKRSDYSVTIGLFAPAIIWFLHLFTASIAAEWGVTAGWNRRYFAGISMITILILVISMVAIGLTVLSLRRVAHFHPRFKRQLSERITTEHSEQFLGSVAICSGVIFLAITCIQTVPILFFMGND
jgi:hypothetical protein